MWAPCELAVSSNSWYLWNSIQGMALWCGMPVLMPYMTLTSLWSVEVKKKKHFSSQISRLMVKGLTSQVAGLGFSSPSGCEVGCPGWTTRANRHRSLIRKEWHKIADSWHWYNNAIYAHQLSRKLIYFNQCLLFCNKKIRGKVSLLSNCVINWYSLYIFTQVCFVSEIVLKDYSQYSCLVSWTDTYINLKPSQRPWLR